MTGTGAGATTESLRIADSREANDAGSATRTAACGSRFGASGTPPQRDFQSDPAHGSKRKGDVHHFSSRRLPFHIGSHGRSQRTDVAVALKGFTQSWRANKVATSRAPALASPARQTSEHALDNSAVVVLRIELAGSYTTAPRFARCFDWASACRFRQGCCLQRFSETKATSAHAKVALLNKVHATRGFVLSQRLLSQQFRVAMGPCTTIPFDWVQDGRLSPAPTLSRHDPSSPTSRRKGNSKRKLTDDGSCSP